MDVEGRYHRWRLRSKLRSRIQRILNGPLLVESASSLNSEEFEHVSHVTGYLSSSGESDGPFSSSSDLDHLWREAILEQERILDKTEAAIGPERLFESVHRGNDSRSSDQEILPNVMMEITAEDIDDDPNSSSTSELDNTTDPSFQAVSSKGFTDVPPNCRTPVEDISYMKRYCTTYTSYYFMNISDDASEAQINSSN